MDLDVTAAIPFLTILLSGVVSYFVSNRVSSKNIQKEHKMLERREKRKWYLEAHQLAVRTQEDWFHAITQDPENPRTEPDSLLMNQRKEVRDHIAKGYALQVDVQTLNSLRKVEEGLKLSIGGWSTSMMGDIEDEFTSTVDIVIEQTREKIEQLSESDLESHHLVFR